MDKKVDRLDKLKERLQKARVYYSFPNPQADYQMDIVDAEDDFRWMIYEIERLRKLAGPAERS
jgi:hypothetical protein